MLTAGFPDLPAMDANVPGNVYVADAATRDRLTPQRHPGNHWQISQSTNAYADTAVYDWLAAQRRITPPAVAAAAH